MRQAIVERITRALLALDTDRLPEGVDAEAMDLSDVEAAKIDGNNRYTVDGAGVVTATAAIDQGEIDDAANLERVKTLAASAVGVALADLTAAQVRALLAVLLWSHGAIAPSGAIAPLVEWARK